MQSSVKAIRAGKKRIDEGDGYLDFSGETLRMWDMALM